MSIFLTLFLFCISSEVQAMVTSQSPLKSEIAIDPLSIFLTLIFAVLAQLVEHNLAKVVVASSNLAYRLPHDDA